MSEVEEFCDTVFVINHGRLVASGRVKELLKPHERIVRVTFQGKVPDAEFISRHEQIRKVEAVGSGHRGDHAGAGRFGVAEPVPAAGGISGFSHCAQTEDVEGVFPFHHGHAGGRQTP